jgi:hypothetical protein
MHEWLRKARSSPVILSAAKDLSADRDRPFAEFTLSEANGLRVTGMLSKCLRESRVILECVCVHNVYYLGACCYHKEKVLTHGYSS